MDIGGYKLDLAEQIEPSVGATFVGKKDALLVAREKSADKYELELLQLPRLKSLRRKTVKTVATITRVGEKHVLLMLPEDLEDSAKEWQRTFEIRRLSDFRVEASFVEEKPGHVAAHPDGSLIAVAHDFGGLNVWDARTGELVSTYSSKGIGGVAYSHDGKLLVAKEFGGALKFFDAEEPDKKPLRSVMLGRGTAAVAFHPRQPWVAAADKQAIRIVDAETAKVQSSIKVTKKESQGTIRRMAFSPDGRLLVTATRSDNVVGLWNVEQDEFVGHVKEFDTPLGQVEFDDKGKYLLISTFQSAELYTISKA